MRRGRSARARAPGRRKRRRRRATLRRARTSRATRACGRLGGAARARSAPRSSCGRARAVARCAHRRILACRSEVAPAGGMMTAMPAGTERDLRPLFEPRSVAVVGASNDPAKWGQWLARGALRGRAPARRLPRQPVRRRGARPTGLPLARGAARAAGARRARGSGVRVRGDGRGLARGRRARDRRDRGGARRELGGGPPSASRRSSSGFARRRRGPARAELHRRLRRCGRARPLLERLRPGADRAGLAERQPRDRDLAAGLGGRPRHLALRLARQPGRPRGGTRSSRRSRRTTRRR